MTNSQISGVEARTFLTWVRSRQSLNLSFHVISKKYVDTLELRVGISLLDGCDSDGILHVLVFSKFYFKV